MEDLCSRLDELSCAVTNGADAVSRNFNISIPAEVDRDADIVIREASNRLHKLNKRSYNIANQHNLKPASERASARIEVKCREADKARLKALARDAGLNLSQFILNKCLNI